jgi:hypothetical protein
MNTEMPSFVSHFSAAEIWSADDPLLVCRQFAAHVQTVASIVDVTTKTYCSNFAAFLMLAPSKKEISYIIMYIHT